ncbi:phosphotransferase family protein [Pseudomonas frederiksbergensis]|uniref:Aminoglycoside phosphotransferase domain-containing protein n=1 Tax=Pseudomonas frederiksbergensis TaxID=104087 RepID=A0AB33EG75_9PSED|nr:phosphotransferase family protein [Pseudomonas frederiksbergensis]ATE78217.1 hypothetical protein CNN82_17950 [Pseudomonas frederiksbergensis]
MKIQKHRLLSGLQQAIDKLAMLGDPLRVKEHHLAAHAILAELVRGERLHDVRDQYECGYSLGLRLARAIGRVDASLVCKLPPRIFHSYDQAATHALFYRLQSALANLVAVSGYPVGGDSEIDAVVLSLMRWEASLYELPSLPESPQSRQPDMQAMLERSVRNQGGALTHARFLQCEQLLDSFGNTALFFEVEDADSHRWPLVCRVQKDNVPLGLRSSVADEFRLLRYLHQQGLSVGEPLWLESKRSIEQLPFSVSRRLTGTQLQTWVDLQSLNGSQIQALASELAKIHGVRLQASDGVLQDNFMDPTDSEPRAVVAAQRYLDRWVDLWKSSDTAPSSILLATLQWLRVNAPQSDDEPVLVHGDYSPSNVVFDDDQVASVVDWSHAHVGDRAEDLAYLLPSLGSHAQADLFMREYVAAGGNTVSQFQLKYYAVMDQFKRLVTLQEARLRFDMSHADPEFCILGFQSIQMPASNVGAAICAAEAARHVM